MSKAWTWKGRTVACRKFSAHSFVPRNEASRFEPPANDLAWPAAAGGKTESRAVRRARREAAWREKGPTKEQREAYQAGTPLPAGENYVATSSTAADASAVLRVESDTSTQSAAPSDSSASSAGESAVPRVESDASTQSTAASSEGDVAVPRVEPPLSEATVVVTPEGDASAGP